MKINNLRVSLPETMAIEIKTIESISPIIKRYDTGEQPVLLDCNDGYSYICKCGKSSGSEYKLVCELLGYILAKSWGLNVPEASFIKIKTSHLYKSVVDDSSSELLGFGSRFIPDVIDVTDLMIPALKKNDALQEELLHIALFDMWVANEDRNINNYNMLYNVKSRMFVPIDFGCIFNTATFDYPLSQLTMSDSLLYSDLFHSLRCNDYVLDCRVLEKLQIKLREQVGLCNTVLPVLQNILPKEWHVPYDLVQKKLEELGSYEWKESVWKNFVEILHDNI